LKLPNSNKNLNNNNLSNFITAEELATQKVSKIQIPMFKTKISHLSIKYTGTKIWNAISQKIREPNFRKFSKEYKKV